MRLNPSSAIYIVAFLRCVFRILSNATMTRHTHFQCFNRSLKSGSEGSQGLVLFILVALSTDLARCHLVLTSHT